MCSSEGTLKAQREKQHLMKRNICRPCRCAPPAGGCQDCRYGFRAEILANVAEVMGMGRPNGLQGLQALPSQAEGGWQRSASMLMTSATVSHPICKLSLACCMP